jgi:hypothetical protein
LTRRFMGLAYEITLIALRLVDRGDIANDVVARKILRLRKPVNAILSGWAIPS